MSLRHRLGLGSLGTYFWFLTCSSLSFPASSDSTAFFTITSITYVGGRVARKGDDCDKEVCLLTPKLHSHRDGVEFDISFFKV